ncbi:MAG: hypothetical protein HYT12_03140 [Candidatus Liptonbacteria bacterium]|nr:hypothetical protein [Candidatus Liptonbacteria bacterium]
MSPRLYNRITGCCLLAWVASVFIFDNANFPYNYSFYNLAVGSLGLVAALIAIGIYFYNLYLFKKLE